MQIRAIDIRQMPACKLESSTKDVWSDQVKDLATDSEQGILQVMEMEPANHWEWDSDSSLGLDLVFAQAASQGSRRESPSPESDSLLEHLPVFATLYEPWYFYDSSLWLASLEQSYPPELDQLLPDLLLQYLLLPA